MTRHRGQCAGKKRQRKGGWNLGVGSRGQETGRRIKEAGSRMLRAKLMELLEEGGGSGGFKLNQKVQKMS